MEKVIKKIHELLSDKKAQDIVTLSLFEVTTIADYFILATGTSSTHINALSEHIEKELAKEQIFPRHKEGKRNGEWVLMDYTDIVIHIFNRETRAYYDLERIWSDAKYIEI
ncbi:ribosome silencing factor [Fusibacter ferrireducens]|uniref:Ribosomal silencing factor RsfS n=1 Tax=Fusibacter ferrireducens TaxID=2785058 RepID=A0ABR9ZWQ6_9FIRM|nr:ribosome silencing factor [Fusibacter ferrireducens]MBF4694883.1 ribosome silencing factor [Fusibacter ferrireducens]